MSAHLCLVSQTPELSSDRFQLTHGIYTLGRSSECELVVKNVTVSRKHAQIMVPNSAIKVTDLDSSNGTYLNGQRVGSCLVRPGQQITFGRVTFALALVQAKSDLADSEVATDSCDCDEGVAGEGKTLNVILPRELLSAAQQRIFDLVVCGLPEKEIAQQLNLSPHTIHNHVQAIYRSFGVHSRPQLLARVFRDEGEPARPRGKQKR